MTASSYLTIDGPSQARFTEKMSRFLAFAKPVETEDEAKSWIASLANEYHDARHVCWAYVLGNDRSRSLSSDNGEPSGTAGKPIMGQINSLGLTNVAVAVVRYFGGIKLGTSGLISAYRTAARMALDEAVMVERYVMTAINFTFPYLSMNQVMKAVKHPSVKIIEQQFDNTCRMSVETGIDNREYLRGVLRNVSGLSFLDD